MTEKNDQCTIKPKKMPQSRGEESPVRTKESPEVTVSDAPSPSSDQVA